MTLGIAPSSRPRVLQVAPRFLPQIGGVPTHVKDVVVNLRDFDFVVLKNRMMAETPGPLPPNVRLVSVGPVWRNPRGTGVRRPAGMALQTVAERLRWRNRNAIARRIQVDLVHVHLIDQDYSWRVANRLGLRGSIRRMLRYCARVGGNSGRVLFTEHTLLAAPPTIVPEYIKDMVMDSFKNIACVERRGYQRAVAHRERHGRPRNVWYIPNSVDTEAFRPRAMPPSPPIRIGVASRVRKPGYEHVVSLAHALPESVELWIAFAGDEEEIARFQGDVAGTRVRVFANLRPDEMPAFYSNVHLFFNQFPYTGVGRTTIEAMACGRPVITFESKNVDKYPVSPENGFLVRPSPTDIVTLLESLAEGPEPIETKGRRARIAVETELSHDILMPRLATVYWNMLEEAE